MIKNILKNKKIIITIIAVIIAVVGIVFLISNCDRNKNNNNINGLNPLIGESGYNFKITPNKIIFTVPVKKDNSVESSFHGLDLNSLNQTSNLAFNNSFPNIQNIGYSADDTKVFYKYQESIKSATKNGIIDFSKNQFYELNDRIVDLIFLNGTNKIVYTFNNEDGTITLNIADTDGKNWQVLKELDFTDKGYYLVDLNDKEIVYSKRHAPTEIDIYENIYQFNVESKQEKIIYSKYPTSQTVFSPDGKKFVANFFLERPIAGVRNLENNSSSIFFLDYSKEEYISAAWINNNQALISITDYTTNKQSLLLLDLGKNNLERYSIDEKIMDLLNNLQVQDGYLYFSITDKLYRLKLSELLKSNKWKLEKSDIMKEEKDME